MNSERLLSYVLEELKFDPRVDASGVAVRVDDRIVTLSGHVHSCADKAAAVAAATRVKGVRGVVVDLQVMPAPDGAVADAEIAERAANVLRWNAALPRDALKTSVEAGCVTLSGTVDWQFQRAEAERDVRALAGVVGVRNDVALRSVSRKADIRHSIGDAMRRMADVEAARIRVDVDPDGRVTLKGKVPDWRARNAVEDAAWLVAGVRGVDNRVRVR